MSLQYEGWKKEGFSLLVNFITKYSLFLVLEKPLLFYVIFNTFFFSLRIVDAKDIKGKTAAILTELSLYCAHIYGCILLKFIRKLTFKSNSFLKGILLLLLFVLLSFNE